MTKQETTDLRADVKDEHKAIKDYGKHAARARDSGARTIFKRNQSEERGHLARLQGHAKVHGLRGLR